jgi:hypothetical protein
MITADSVSSEEKNRLQEELNQRLEKEIAAQIQIENLTSELNECKKENELLKADNTVLKEQIPKKKKRRWLLF